ncbi:MAG: monoamine oxidase [Vicingaceae bacterium]|jgi:monoamine oxidase
MKFRSILLVLVITSLTFCLSGCFKWAARTESKLPKETALHKTYNYDGKIIIVGAGASGLAAAKVLEQNNIDYIILGVTNRYGGRLKSDTTLTDFPIDIGAEWLHNTSITLNKLKGKRGKEIDEKLIPYHLDKTANWDGKEYKINPRWQNNFMYNFMPESKFKSSTWYDFVNENIDKTVKHKIQFNSPITAIDNSGNKVIVKTKNGNNYESDRVLVTVSIGVLNSNKIIFTPEINEKKKETIESITFHPGFKVVMKFSEKFYPDAINCKVDKGEKGSYDIAFKKDAQTNVLGFLCLGNETQKYYDFNSEQEIISRVRSYV